MKVRPSQSVSPTAMWLLLPLPSLTALPYLDSGAPRSGPTWAGPGQTSTEPVAVRLWEEPGIQGPRAQAVHGVSGSMGSSFGEPCVFH